MRLWNRNFRHGVIYLWKYALAFFIFAVNAQDAFADKKVRGQAELYTHERYIAETKRRTAIDLTDPLAVFFWILERLPNEVVVYPTENYYYFKFTHMGSNYAGNIRLDASDRDEGFVHFAYDRQYYPWHRVIDPIYRKLSTRDGVMVKKVEALTYAISYKGKRRIFRLNDLTRVKPLSVQIGKDEQYIGPVYDESGVQFFLMFNSRLRIFLYVLNEQNSLAEQLVEKKKRTYIGLRSGFAYYQDKFYDRKILIGVHKHNYYVNNYFDGPFDQLPDNFIKGNSLKRAIIAIYPDLADQVDRFGRYYERDLRVMIKPYLIYEDIVDLEIISTCAQQVKLLKRDYYRCFSYQEEKNTLGINELPTGKTPRTGQLNTPGPFLGCKGRAQLIIRPNNLGTQNSCTSTNGKNIQ